MSNPDLTQPNLQEAVRAYQAGDHDQARQIVDQIVSTDPQNADAWYLASFLAHDRPASIHSLERALAINPAHRLASRRLQSLNAPGEVSENTPGMNEAEVTSLGQLLAGTDSPRKRKPLNVIEDKPKGKPKPRKHKSSQVVLDTRHFIGILLLVGGSAAALAFVLLFTLRSRTETSVATPTPFIVTATQTFDSLATPTMIFDSRIWNWAYPVVLKEAFQGFPRGTLVTINSASYSRHAWTYNVTTQDGISFAVPEMLVAAPPDAPVNPAATPVARFQDYIGIGGYVFLTIEQVGLIPASTRVRISQARFNGQEWIYGIVAQDEQHAGEARESQLIYAPDSTPGPTPTPTLPG